MSRIFFKPCNASSLGAMLLLLEVIIYWEAWVKSQERRRKMAGKFSDWS